ncbi:helix-turn-helix transcriptional regulator [Winogradskya humida]|uniref:HTH luxR-type domain-containing protein n=1 Tax=Winogradskya humida TaxID=113566 RepID=A0ABQ3ZZA8_9ACTN|nr:LuxR family transcriptional regulator [Actinoplanes humidus]GIE23784.1 hypothetical protein Ahu01nite_068860 [Actinoplanes humidus]
MGCPDIARDLRPAPFVGRERELRYATGLLGAAAPGQVTVLVVEGAAGSGRTRFLRELGAAACRLGVTVTDAPEWTFAGPLMFCSDRPLRITARTWDGLDLLAESAPVLVVVTARTGHDPLPLDRLTSPSVHRLTLAPLPPADVGLLASELLGRPPGRELVDLLRVAAGRPGAVRDLITGLQEEGRVTVAEPPALPRRTQSWVSGQLAALSPQARHLLQAATTLRSPFPLVELTRLVRVSPVRVVPAIGEALESGLLVGDGEMLSFSHDLVRAIVTDSLPRPIAAALRVEPERQGWDLLSSREREVAELAGHALTNQQIANRVRLSPHTVNYHLRQIFQKLGITSRVELATVMRDHSAAPPST